MPYNTFSRVCLSVHRLCLGCRTYFTDSARNISGREVGGHSGGCAPVASPSQGVSWSWRRFTDTTATFLHS